MKTLGSIYKGILILVGVIFILGIYLGYTYSNVGEVSHTVITSSPSIQAVKSVALDSTKLLFTIWIANSIVALGLILLSFGKKWSKYTKYSIYFVISYQFITIALLIGYAAHFTSTNLIAASLIPHGVIEVPIILLAAAYGIYLCQDVKDNIKTIIKTYIFYILTPLFIAALLETYITPVVMTMLK